MLRSLNSLVRTWASTNIHCKSNAAKRISIDIYLKFMLINKTVQILIKSYPIKRRANGKI